ncbi:MAG: alpha/beta fold hydrolase [Ardenticatenaceae bacterium]
MKKGIIIGASTLLGLVGMGALFLWRNMFKPLYEPGMVRAGTNLGAPLAPPAQSNDCQFWNVERDVRLWHFSEGEGRNVLIVHGGPGFPYTTPWLGLAGLTNEYQFHYYDQRGCGQSTRPFDRFSSNYYQNMTTLERTLGIGAQVADMERIRQILGEEKLIIIGHSFGAFLASLYATEFPDHVEALVLLSPADVLVMPQKEGQGLFEEVRKRLPEEMQEEYAAYLKDYLDFQNIFSKSEADLIALNQEFVKYYQAAIETSLLEQAKAGGWMVFAMYFSMGQRHDYTNALQDVKTPVLVIHGADDLQTAEASRAYADAFPNAKFEIIENTGHSSFTDQPEAFLNVVAEFLSELK